MSKDVSKEEFESKDSISVVSQIGLQKRNCSSLSAYFHIVCCVAGTGTLSLPYAMKTGGWIALLMFFITALVSTYTARLLIECLYYKPGERLAEFPDIGEAAFGKPGRYFTKVFHYSVSLSCGCIYILLTGHNIYVFLKDFEYEPLPEYVWILLSGLVITITFSLLKTMKEVVFLSGFGTLATMICVVIVAIVGGIEYATPGISRPNTTIINLTEFPMAVATIAFSYGGNVVYPHVEATMRNPKAWNMTVFYAVISITLMYVTMGGLGYLYYGDTVQSPILDSLPVNFGTRIAYIFITLHVAFAAPIYLCSFSLEQEAILKIDTTHLSKPKELLYRVIFRGTVGAVLTLIAMFVPHFSALCGIFGAVSNCIVVFLFPVVCHYKLLGSRNRPIWQQLVCTFILFLGLFGLILGTKSAIQDLFNSIEKDRLIDIVKQLPIRANQANLPDLLTQVKKATDGKFNINQLKKLIDTLHQT